MKNSRGKRNNTELMKLWGNKWVNLKFMKWDTINFKKLWENSCDQIIFWNQIECEFVIQAQINNDKFFYIACIFVASST